MGPWDPQAMIPIGPKALEMGPMIDGDKVGTVKLYRICKLYWSPKTNVPWHAPVVIQIFMETAEMAWPVVADMFSTSIVLWETQGLTNLSNDKTSYYLVNRCTVMEIISSFQIWHYTGVTALIWNSWFKFSVINFMVKVQFRGPELFKNKANLRDLKAVTGL